MTAQLFPPDRSLDSLAFTDLLLQQAELAVANADVDSDIEVEGGRDRTLPPAPLSQAWVAGWLNCLAFLEQTQPAVATKLRQAYEQQHTGQLATSVKVAPPVEQAAEAAPLTASELDGIARKIHHSLDENEVCSAIVKALCAALEGDCAGLILYDLTAQTLEVVAVYHRTEAKPEEAVPVGLTLRLGTGGDRNFCWNSVKPWVAQDVETAAIPEMERLLLQASGVHSTLMVPIFHEDRMLGTAYVSQTISCRLWTATEMQLAEEVAGQAAIALHHARLYGEMQRRAELERGLNRIAQRIRTSLAIETTINTALAELLALTNAEAMMFTVPATGDSGPLEVVHCVRDNKASTNSQIDLCEIEVSKGYGPELMHRLLSQEMTVLPNTQSASLEESSRAAFQQQQIGAFLCAPVWHQGQLLGQLLASKQEPFSWSGDDTAAIEAMATQLAIAIAQAQLYNRTQQQAETAQAQAEKLTRTLDQLYTTQSQLVQSEKMSSLGQMVAGIAHEINNPINFISGNIPFLTNYAEDLLELLRRYQVVTPNPPDAIADFCTEIDLPFIRTDLTRILDSMSTGVERVREIVSGLRNFSRLDEADLKSVDIHEGIESSLTLLNHRLKAMGIDAIAQYGDLPNVSCYPSQLNQVFMNILTNAIDAISQKTTNACSDQPDLGKITIATTTLSKREGQDWVQIAIFDNGCGIAPQNRDKIFDPFFTTKPVGSGKGLGLAIAYQIVVQAHQGRLWFETSAHTGTTFFIELPLSQLDVVQGNSVLRT